MSRVGDLWRRLRGKPRRQGKAAAMPTVRYATSPLLASRPIMKGCELTLSSIKRPL